MRRRQRSRGHCKNCGSHFSTKKPTANGKFSLIASFDCEFHIVPDDPGFDRLIEVEPAINDDAAKKRAKYEFFYTDSERELKRKARETRS